jgi:hypothetical protein
MLSPFADVSPKDLSPLDAVSATDADAIGDLVDRARGAQRAWSELPAYERAARIAKVKDRLLDRAAALAALVSREVGKPEAEALLGEVLASADVFDFWCGSIEELCEPQEIALDKLTYPAKRGTIYREARGTLAVIMPWNFPVALPLRTLVPALLAGNAVVFKPSEIAPRSGQAVVDLFAGLIPDGVLTIAQGGGDVGAALCCANVDLVVFTGSVATGRKVATACAERLAPCSLELGGKDAAIVLSDANLERAAQGIAWAALTNAGQNCAAIERVYVERGISDAFIARLTEVVRALEPDRDLGPLTTHAQQQTVVRHVADAQASGAEVILGGNAGQDGYRYPATIVKVTSDDIDLMREETFGPVIAVRVVESASEAIALANASKYGLTASIWTKRASHGESLAHELRAGVVTINNPAFTGALPAAPWSGHGQTGTGITNSHLALEALTRPRFVLVDRSSSKRELWWYPYTPALMKIGLAMAALRSGSTGLVRKIGAVLSLLGAFPRRFR